MKVDLYKVIFLLILIVGAFFRLYSLDTAPPQLNLDEVSNVYNAYSILKTGADEYGYKFPVLMRAYDDYRPAINVYATIPFVAIFGMNPWSAKLPSAIISIITIAAVYFLTKELLKGSKTTKIGSFNLSIPLIVMGFFAVAPWDIYISRLGYEVNFAFSFLIFGILFFLRYVNRRDDKYNAFNLFASAVFFALSFGSYQSTKIVAPLIVVLLSVTYLKELLKNKRTLVIAALIGIVFAFPILLTLLDKSSLLRFKGTDLLSNSQTYFEKIKNRSELESRDGDILGKVFDNHKAASGLLISHAYLSHLSPVWLFINQEGEQFKAPTVGLLYLFELPLVLLGILFLTKLVVSTRSVIIIIFWAAIAIVPAAITTGYAHPLRIMNILPVPQIISAIGLFVLIEFINNKYKKLKNILFIVISGVFLYSVVWFYHSYFVLMPKELGHHFQHGTLDALAKAQVLSKNYDNVYVSGNDKLFGSYMFYLYHTKFDPFKHQENGGTKEAGFTSKHKIGKFIFGDLKIEDPNSLFVLSPGELKNGMKIVDKIYYSDGRVALLLADNK